MSEPQRIVSASLALALVLTLAQACGGGQVNEDPPPLCYASHPVPDGGGVRSLRNDEYADVVVRSYRSGQTTTQDCRGDAVTWRPTDRSCAIHEAEDEPAPTAVPVTEESVVVGRTEGSYTRKVVWVITHHFEDGDGFGPVALVERTTDGVAVRALGTVRIPRERARLRLRRTGGREILVAEGERCPPPSEDGAGPGDNAPPVNVEGETGETDEPPTCLRMARLLPLVGDRFVNPELRDEEGACLGPALFYTAREVNEGLANGWQRRFRLAASLEYRGGAVIVHEQVQAHDLDPRDPGVPPRAFRTTDSDRVIYLGPRGEMRSRGLPLFERTIRAHGSTQLPVAEAPESE